MNVQPLYWRDLDRLTRKLNAIRIGCHRLDAGVLRPSVVRHRIERDLMRLEEAIDAAGSRMTVALIQRDLDRRMQERIES